MHSFFKPRRLALFQKLVSPFLLLIALVLASGSREARAWWMWTPGDTVDDVGYKPTQPIPFSHALHAGKRQIPCEYCHSAARRSASAGIPPLNTCMGCHKVVRTDKEPIKWLTEKYNKNEPVEWVKVHDSPQYVHFTHKQHVAAGIDCQTCHGKVENMEVVEQVAPLQMGWCIGCHKEKGASINCITCHY
jgi:hypothetical protein